MRQITFDTKSFSLAIDAARWAKKQSWKQVAEEAGVSKATLCRIQQGKSPDVDTLARLLHWCGMDFKRFINVACEKIAISPKLEEAVLDLKNNPKRKEPRQ